MARVRYTKRKAPKTGAAKTRAAITPAAEIRAAKTPAERAKKTTNLAHPCREDYSLFSEPNVENFLNEEWGQPSPAPTQHSKSVLPCSNAAAHPNGPHYICIDCSTLAHTHLRNDPHGLLRGGHPARKGQRFFQLCKKCTKAARTSAKQGCFCFDQTLCFQCKCDTLAFAVAKRDVEVERNRLGFVPWGEMGDGEWCLMKPVLNCVCGEEELEVGDGKEGILRCAGCEGTVIKTGGQVWDPFAMRFVDVFG